MFITEDKRTQLISKSKSAEKEKDGKTRYQKRVKSKVCVRKIYTYDLTFHPKSGII